MSTPADRENPFAPPRAALDAATSPGELVADGQQVNAGRGGSWLSAGWKIFLQAPGVWIGITFMFAILWIVLAIIPLGGLVTNLLFPVFVGGLMLGCRGLEEGTPLPFSSLFAGFQSHAGPLLITGLLYLVGAVVIGIVIGLGVLAALIPTIKTASSGNPGDILNAGLWMALAVLLGAALMLPLVMAIWFAPALVIFHDVAPMTAMRMSFSGCLKNFIPFLVYGIIAFFLAIAATIPLGLGWLVLMPVTWGSMYAGYRDIYVRPA